MASRVNYHRINSAQFFALRVAIVDCFNGKTIDHVVRAINRPKLAVLVKDEAFKWMAGDLIDLARQEGWLETLVNGCRSASQNMEIQDIESKLAMLNVEGNPILVGGSLERTVREKA